MLNIEHLSGNIVSSTGVSAYKKYLDEITQYVNQRMEILNLEHKLIGGNPLAMMIDNHNNHGIFMLNVFGLNDYEMLYNTLPWVFSSYESKGFKSSYFDYALVEWKDAINKYLEPNESSGILRVYDWIEKIKPEIESKRAEDIVVVPYPFNRKWKLIKDEFLELLLKGNVNKALKYAESIIYDIESLKIFYRGVITYALYQVGKLWEAGDISIAREHLVTSMVVRIMSSLYMKFVLLEPSKGTLVVTSATNEYHEIGARMLADLFELDGWDCHYLGANMPKEDIIEFICKEQPTALAISVTMSYNIDNTIELIKDIQSDKRCKGIHIMIGGLAFSYSETMTMIQGVPIINDVDKAIVMVDRWKELSDE